MAGCSTRRLRSRSAGGGDGRIRRLQDRRRCRCSRRGDRHGSFSRRGLGRHQARLDPPTHPATDIWPARPYRGSALWDPAHRPNSLTAALDSPVRPAEQRFRSRRAPRRQGRLADLSEDHRRLRRHQPPPRKTRDDQADRIDPASRARWAGGDRPTWPHPMAPPRRHPGVLRPPRLQRPNRSHQRTLGSPAPQRPRIPQPHPLPNPLTATQRRTPPTRQCTLKYEEPEKVVTSAGLVFAFTMLAMLSSDLRTIGQVGSTVCIGLLLDTLIVRSFVVPCILSILGKWFWWPTLVRSRPLPPR